jgi:hypothetical protein
VRLDSAPVSFYPQGSYVARSGNPLAPDVDSCDLWDGVGLQFLPPHAAARHRGVYLLVARLRGVHGPNRRGTSGGASRDADGGPAWVDDVLGRRGCAGRLRGAVLEGRAVIYTWRVRTRFPERFGQPCAVLIRGGMNTCLVEFADGFRAYTSRNYVRRAK